MPANEAPAIPVGHGRPRTNARHENADGDPQEATQRRSLDFVSTTLIDGRRFRILCIIDDFSRECLDIAADNGKEFIAGVGREWIAVMGAKSAFIEPGSPGRTTTA